MALITYLTRIQFEAGALALLPAELAGLGVRRPLIASDRGVVEAGLVDRALALVGRDTPVFDGTPSNPSEAAAHAALALYREQGCDGLIALGGGSAIDLAKAVALLATHVGSLGDYGVQDGGSERIGEVAPVLAIPTTAGTGAEVGRAASLTVGDGRKIACVSPRLIPRAVICDPVLTYGLPARLTAATGIDALSHGIESFLSPRINPPAEAIALDCVARAARWLPVAARRPEDAEARWQMMMAALEGGLTFQKGLGAVHAASHPLGATGFHHGELNAVLLPPVLRFNARHASARIRRLAEIVGAGSDLAAWCAALARDLGLPTTLRELGVERSGLSAVAELAAGEHLNLTNPKPATADEFRAILDEALG